MWIVEVIPVSRSFLKDEALTYFSTKKLEPGALVEIGLRHSVSLAIAVSSERLEAKRASVKRGPFALKKIGKVMAGYFINPKFIEPLNETAEYFMTGRSLLLRFFLPKTILNKSFCSNYSKMLDFVSRAPDINFQTSSYQAERQERIKYYRAILRETLSRGHSAAILLPTASLAQDAFDDLKTGIEERTFILHGDLSAKQLSDAWYGVFSSANPVVVVGTAPILAFLRPDTETLIVDEESSEYYYNSRRRPFFDLRRTARSIAEKMGLRLIFGDIILRLDADTEYASASSSGRVLSSAENKIINVSEKSAGETFKILSPELAGRISGAQAKKESFVLIGHRKGLSPTTLCQDCGQTIVCTRCSSPLVIHQKNENQKHFFCHYCLKKEEIIERCPNCKSWRLASYGVGVEKIGEELKKLRPEAKLFRFDGDTIKSRKEAEEIRRSFSEKPGSIMIATEIFVNFFRNPVPHIAVAAIDGLFSMPDYRMHERVLNFLIRLRALAQKSFILQTRLSEHPVFNYAVSGNISGFRNEELRNREKLGYPPAVDLIKISAEDADRDKVAKLVSALAEEIKNAVNPENAYIDCVDFPAFIVKIRNRFRWHILLRLKRGSWPASHPKIKNILANLAPSWSIQVDPPSLL